MRLIPAAVIAAALTLTGGALPHLGPAWIDAPAAVMLCAGILTLATIARRAWSA